MPPEAAVRILITELVARGVKVVNKGNRVLIPLARTLMLCPLQSRLLVLPFKIEGSGLRGIVSTSQISGLFISPISLRRNRIVRRVSDTFPIYVCLLQLVHVLPCAINSNTFEIK